MLLVPKCTATVSSLARNPTTILKKQALSCWKLLFLLLFILNEWKKHRGYVFLCPLYSHCSKHLHLISPSFCLQMFLYSCQPRETPSQVHRLVSPAAALGSLSLRNRSWPTYCVSLLPQVFKCVMGLPPFLQDLLTATIREHAAASPVLSYCNPNFLSIQGFPST